MSEFKSNFTGNDLREKFGPAGLQTGLGKIALELLIDFEFAKQKLVKLREQVACFSVHPSTVNKDLEKMVQKEQSRADRMHRHNNYLQSKVDVLKLFVGHINNCSKLDSVDADCKCGLDGALAMKERL